MSSGRRAPSKPAPNTANSKPNTTATASGSSGPSTSSTSADTPPVRIKQEPGTQQAIKTERLPSYREQRDLTLGGLSGGRNSRGAANKKVFVPNLNVTRNKNADVHTSRDTSATGRGRGRGDRKSERGARTPKPSTLVQLSGLFSEGTGEAKLRKSSSVFDRNAGAGDSASQLRRPTLIKRETKFDQNAERQSIQEVLGTMMADDDEADAAAEAGAATTGSAQTDLFAPIALQESRSMMASSGNSVRLPESLEELFAKVEQQLFLMQLPDTLPGHGPDVEPAESAEAETAAAAAMAADPLSSYCTARQLDDGLVGRVVRRRSGKIQMILGDVVFNLSLGIDAGMLQEVMSVQPTEPDRRHGTLNNLGTIQAKLNVTPDWELLFAAKAAESRRRTVTPSNGDYNVGLRG